MLSPADADVVRRDRDLPDLVLLLDPDRLAAGLARTCAQYGISGVTTTYLRYKPGESCLAACRAEVDGQPVDFIAKAYRPGATGKLQKSLLRSATPGPLGAGRFAIHGSHVVVSVFPNDAMVERLARLMTSESLGELAARIGHRAAADRVETLRHNPERRYVGRLMADGTPVATLRCYTATDYASIAEKSRALISRGPLRVPSRLTRMRRLRLLAFEWLHGDVLEDVIAGRTGHSKTLELVGAALAHLHDQDSPALPRRTDAADAAGIVALADCLGRLHPPIGGRARELSERIAVRLAQETVMPRPLHGDFYAKQVVLVGGKAALIDLDEATLGDPAVDLARFRADLESGAVSGRLTAAGVDALVEPLLSGYRRTRSLPARLDLHVASQLFRLAVHPFRRRDPAWPDIVSAILDRAEAFLNRDAKLSSPRTAVVSAHQRHQRLTADGWDVAETPHIRPARAIDPRVIDTFGIVNDSLMPFLASTLQPEEMAPRFGRSLGSIDGATHVDVRAISVTRYKPNLRCLIAYDLALHDATGGKRLLSVMGKVRVQSADLSTHQLQESLWTGSFGARATDGIVVPEPLGWIADVHMILQRRVPGESLGRLLDGPSGLWLARRAAEAIHKLHCTSMPVRRRHTADDELRILRERLTRLAQDHRRWAARIERLVEGCARLAAMLGDGALCGIHRDFYPDQLLADGDRIYLTDLDLYREGPPALDVGNFVAHVQEYSLRRFGDEHGLADRNDTLIERYLQLSDRTTRKVIETWTTLSLARLVAISTQFADRRPFTEALLDLCERRVFGAPMANRLNGLAYGAPKGAAS